MFNTVLATVLVSIVTAVLGVLGKVISDWGQRQKVIEEQNKVTEEQYQASQAKDDALDAIRTGVAKAQQLIVDNAKAMADDGRISKDELKDNLKEAARIAEQTALEIATGPALDWLSGLASEAIGGLIDRVLQQNKKE